MTLLPALILCVSGSCVEARPPLCPDFRSTYERSQKTMQFPCLLDPTIRVEFEDKASKGIPDYDVWLWQFYMDDMHSEKDAMPWLRMAAKRGVPSAEFWLGAWLLKSDSPKFLQEGSDWITRAAKDSPWAFSFDVSLLYLNELDNRREGMKWLRKASLLGQSVAIQELIFELSAGGGTQEACTWLTAANDLSIISWVAKDKQPKCKELLDSAQLSRVMRDGRALGEQLEKSRSAHNLEFKKCTGDDAPDL